MLEQELRGKLITLLARLGDKYEQAQHPALLVTTHVDEVLALIKEAGYVKLAKDQTLPPYSGNLIDLGVRVEKARDIVLLKAGWRKVELEEK